jgi:hypothetical protein
MNEVFFISPFTGEIHQGSSMHFIGLIFYKKNYIHFFRSRALLHIPVPAVCGEVCLPERLQLPPRRRRTR